jgi:hypothetical protein
MCGRGRPHDSRRDAGGTKEKGSEGAEIEKRVAIEKRAMEWNENRVGREGGAGGRGGRAGREG